jgi:hypothetical protein
MSTDLPIPSLPINIDRESCIFILSALRTYVLSKNAANMTKIAAAFAICFLLVVSDVEARRHSDHHRRRRNYKQLFVFGDSLADNGNLQRSGLSSGSRGWYYPYGISDSTHGNRATGRFSDGLVQSDFLGIYIYYLLCSYL